MSPRFAVLFALFFSVRLCRADHAEALKLEAEGCKALNEYQFEKGLEFFNKAIAMEPTWPEFYADRGNAKSLLVRHLEAVEDYNKFFDLDLKRKPSDPTSIRDVRYLRGRSYIKLERWEEAVEDFEWTLNFEPEYKSSCRALYGEALMRVGELDRAQEELEKGFLENPENVSGLANIRFLKAEWDETRKAADRMKGTINEVNGGMYRVFALVEQGKYAEAEALSQAMQKAEPSDMATMAVCYVRGTPAAPQYSPISSLKGLNDGLRELKAMNLVRQGYMAVWARLLVLAGRYQEAVDLISTKPTGVSFEYYFWLGSAYWKLDRLKEARETFWTARRLNPYLMKHASRMPGIASFLEAIEKEAGAELANQASIRRQRKEEVLRTLTLGEIEALARQYSFALAAATAKPLRDSLASAARKAELDDRIRDFEGMAALLKRVVAGVNAGGAPLEVRVGSTALTLVKADEAAFEFKIPKGSGKYRWAALDAGEFAALAVKFPLSDEERFSLGILLWDLGALAESWKQLDEAARKSPSLVPRLSRLISRRRGLPAPSEGFVFFRSRWVTPEERGNLEKGLVRWEGAWVSAADHEKLARGLVKVKDQWVPADDAELLGRGFRKEKDRWLSPQEAAELHSAWDKAWVFETAHYRIKTNAGETFGKELASLIEVAYGRYKEFWGGKEPKLQKDEKMDLYAFGTYEDYRKFCVEKKAEQFLNAAGFAQDTTGIGAGWDKLDNKSFFLETMVHEAAHLYYYEISSNRRTPSWLDEAMATYFEGFERNGLEWRFSTIVKNRAWLARQALEKNELIPLSEFLKLDAATLINTKPGQSLVFYAQAWAFNVYLTTTDDPVYRSGYKAFRKDMDDGKVHPLSDYIKDQKKLEQDFKVFVKGL